MAWALRELLWHVQGQPKPNVLFGYVSLRDVCAEYARDQIANRRFWFSSLLQFNDPFEAHVTFSFRGRARDWAREFPGAQLPSGETLATLSRELHKGAREDAARIGMLCLSERGDNVQMWSHYADHHRGACLEFRDGVFARQAQPVRYSRRHPEVRFFSQDKDERGRRILLTKADDWAYEREWRVLDAEGGPGLRVVQDAGLACVILGCRTTPQDEQRVRQWIQQSGTPLELRRATRSETSYALRIIPAD